MTQATEKAIKVPMDVVYQPSWLTWVGSTATCLKALGIDCDTVDVGGMSGYAFMMSVHKELCPSGPTVFDWGSLITGINLMGRSTLVFSSPSCYSPKNKNELTDANCRALFNMVAQEIREGRPCVLWGTYVPEFGVAYGIDGDSYLVKSFKECLKQEQPPIPYDEIEAPGGPYALAFPAAGEISKKGWGDYYAVANAVDHLTSKGPSPMYGRGLKAYDVWIDAMKKNIANPFGNAYNTACYHEGRWLAGEFLSRVAKRQEKVAKRLNKASDEYMKAEKALKSMTEIFPFPPHEEIIEEKNRKEAIKLLKDAKEAEKEALEELEKSLEVEWSEKECKKE